MIRIITAISVLLSVICMSAQDTKDDAQDLKEIMSDKTGRYIQAQARDEDKEAAYQSAFYEFTDKLMA